MAKVIYEFTNATGSDLPDKLGRGEYAYDIPFYADDGYSFESQIFVQNSTSYIKLDYEWGDGRKTTSGTQLSYVSEDFTEIHAHLWFTTTSKLQWGDLTIYIEALPEAPSTPSIPLALDLTNMTASLENGALLEDGNVEITFEANKGYTLDGAFISFNRPNGTTGEERISDSDNTLTFTVNTTYMNDLTISGSANPVTKHISTFNNVYHVSSEDLTELSGVRFASTSTGDVIDYGAYITKLYLLPFEIPDDLLAGTGAIQLGMFNSNVETTVLNDYQFKVDLGKIEVPEKYNNVYDYLQTRCFVYLPFTNRIEIESSYIIDCTIQIEYVVNLYNGESTINIYSSKTEEPIHSETVKVVDDIPFMQTTTGNTLSETNTVYNNGILNPFIIVERNIPYDEVDSVFGGEVVENGILNQFNGYVEVSDFKMTSKATSQEQSEIQTLLRNGVFINGEN